MFGGEGGIPLKGSEEHGAFGQSGRELSLVQQLGSFASFRPFSPVCLRLLFVAIEMSHEMSHAAGSFAAMLYDRCCGAGPAGSAVVSP
jgi:hypothetical protein